MPVLKKYKKTMITLLALFLLIGCKENEPLPGDPWAVSIVMPSFYPVKVTQAYGISNSKDWTIPLIGLHQQYMETSKIDYVRKAFPGYDGFGFPVSPVTSLRGRQIGLGTNHIPDSIYIYWTSLINVRFFVTKYDVTPKVKELMATELYYRRSDGSKGLPCYRTNLFFGLLPNGKTKVWLRGCEQLIYLAELDPAREKDRDQNGTTADEYRQGPTPTPQRVRQRGIDAGISTIPIPWEKVGKIYSKNTVELLSEQ